MSANNLFLFIFLFIDYNACNTSDCNCQDKHEWCNRSIITCFYCGFCRCSVWLWSWSCCNSLGLSNIEVYLFGILFSGILPLTSIILLLVKYNCQSISSCFCNSKCCCIRCTAPTAVKVILDCVVYPSELIPVILLSAGSAIFALRTAFTVKLTLTFALIFCSLSIVIVSV